MRTDGEIAAEADVLQAQTFASHFRADREQLETRLWMQTQRLTAATRADNSVEAATVRRSLRQLEDDLRRVTHILEKLERRFPEALTG
jgi:primosomal protein N''